jgi:hypothetical protein
MVKQLIVSKTGGVVLIVIGIMLSACAPAVSARTMHAAACHPPTIEGNVYRQLPQTILLTNYQNSFLPQSNISYQENLTNQQYEAIRLLATLTERWSDFIDIPLESKYVRITITYLSPTLVQTIMLNHYLFRGTQTFVNGGFEAEITSKMENIANRNEHIFLATLTASTYEQSTSYTDPVIVHLPLQSLVLTNSSNVQVVPQHDDHNLEERIDLTSGPTHGYFSYPMAVTVNETCEFLLDKSTNTHIVLSIPFIDINGIHYETRPWMLDYVPPLDIALDPNPIENRLPVDKDPNHFSPHNELPVSITPVNAEYWENLARFIWHEITQDP